MNLEQPKNEDPKLAQIMKLKQKLENEGMKVFIDESKLDNPEALSRIVDAFAEIKNAYRITVSGADNEVLVDIERSKEEIDKSEERITE